MHNYCITHTYSCVTWYDMVWLLFNWFTARRSFGDEPLTDQSCEIFEYIFYRTILQEGSTLTISPLKCSMRCCYLFSWTTKSIPIYMDFVRKKLQFQANVFWKAAFGSVKHLQWMEKATTMLKYRRKKIEISQKRRGTTAYTKANNITSK